MAHLGNSPNSRGPTSGSLLLRALPFPFLTLRLLPLGSYVLQLVLLIGNPEILVLNSILGKD